MHNNKSKRRFKVAPDPIEEIVQPQIIKWTTRVPKANFEDTSVSVRLRTYHGETEPPSGYHHLVVIEKMAVIEGNNAANFRNSIKNKEGLIGAVDELDNMLGGTADRTQLMGIIKDAIREKDPYTEIRVPLIGRFWISRNDFKKVSGAPGVALAGQTKINDDGTVTDIVDGGAVTSKVIFPETVASDSYSDIDSDVAPTGTRKIKSSSEKNENTPDIVKRSNTGNQSLIKKESTIRKPS